MGFEICTGHQEISLIINYALYKPDKTRAHSIGAGLAPPPQCSPPPHTFNHASPTTSSISTWEGPAGKRRWAVKHVCSVGYLSCSAEIM